MRAIRFALFAEPKDARPAFDEMARAIRERSGLVLEPIFVSSYAGLAQVLESGACDAAWSPPIVAQGLLASDVGKPLVAVGRGGRTSYYAVLLAGRQSEVTGIRALAHARVGWVSKLSAAGYVVPSLYLRSLGFELENLFESQSFLGSHHRVLRALEDGSIDLGATYATVAPAGRTLVLPDRAPAGAHVVVAAGPIPGDVIFAAAHLAVGARESLRCAFLALQVHPDGALAQLMNVDRFEAPQLDHFEKLARWHRRAIESERRIPAAG